jgi:hypothetical protein
VLVIHGERDTVIAPHHGKAVARLHPQAELRLIAQAGHNDLQVFPAYLDAIRDELRRRPNRGIGANP